MCVHHVCIISKFLSDSKISHYEKDDVKYSIDTRFSSWYIAQLELQFIYGGT